MKTSTIYIIFCTAGILLTLVVVGCSNSVSNEAEQPVLESLEFTRSVYRQGDALVIRATPNPNLEEEYFRNNTLNVQLSTTGGEQATAQVSPFSDLTDAEMVEAIKEGADNTAILRIKEADQESARNSNGELVRSQKAINRFVNWTENRKGITVTRKSILQPDILLQFTSGPTVDLVNQVRTHKNVEFMEPNSIGEFTSTSGEPELTGDWATVIPPGRPLEYKPGDTVTATFDQADGTVLKATAQITGK